MPASFIFWWSRYFAAPDQWPEHAILVRRSWVESRNNKSVQQPIENVMLTWKKACRQGNIGALVPIAFTCMVLTPKKKRSGRARALIPFCIEGRRDFLLRCIWTMEKKSMVYCYHQQPLATGQPKTESDAAYLPSFYAYSDKQTIPKTVWQILLASKLLHTKPQIWLCTVSLR